MHGLKAAAAGSMRRRRRVKETRLLLPLLPLLLLLLPSFATAAVRPMECTSFIDQGDLLPANPDPGDDASKSGTAGVLWGVPAPLSPSSSSSSLAAGECHHWTIPPAALRGTACSMDGSARGAGPNRRAPGYLYLEWFRLGRADANGSSASGVGASSPTTLLAFPSAGPGDPPVSPSAAGLASLLQRRAKGLAPVLADGGLASGVYVVAARDGNGGNGNGGNGNGGNGAPGPVFPSVRTTATGEVEFSPPLAGSSPATSSPSPETGAGVTMVDAAAVVLARPYQRSLLPAGGRVPSSAGGNAPPSGQNDGPWRLTVANLNPSARSLAGYVLRATCLPAPPPAAAAAAQRAAAALALAPPASSPAAKRARAAAAAAAAAASAWVPCPAPDPYRGACSGRGSCVSVSAADTLSDTPYIDPLASRQCACSDGFGGVGCARPLKPLPLSLSSSGNSGGEKPLGGGADDGDNNNDNNKWAEVNVPAGGWAHFSLDVPLPANGGPVDGALLVELERAGGQAGPFAGGNPVLFVKPFDSADGGEPSLGGDDVDAYADVPSFALQQERHYALRRLRSSGGAGADAASSSSSSSTAPPRQRWYVAAYNSNSTRLGSGDASLRLRASYRDLAAGQPLACPFDCSHRGRCRDPFSPRDSSGGASGGGDRSLKGDQPARDGFWCECDKGYGGALCEGRQEEVLDVGGGGGRASAMGGGGGELELGPRTLQPGHWDFYVLQLDPSFNYRTHDLAIHWTIGPDAPAVEDEEGRGEEEGEQQAGRRRRRRRRRRRLLSLPRWSAWPLLGASPLLPPPMASSTPTSHPLASLRPATAADLASLVAAEAPARRALLAEAEAGQEGAEGGSSSSPPPPPPSSSFVEEGGVSLSSSSAAAPPATAAAAAAAPLAATAPTPPPTPKPPKPTPPDHPNAFLSFDEDSYPRKGAATTLSGAAAASSGATDAAAAAGAASSSDGSARTPQALHGWLISYSRLLDRHDPPLPLRVSGTELTPGKKYILSVYNSAYAFKTPFTYDLGVFSAAAQREPAVHPYMSIVLGVTAAVVLVLLLTVARRLVARFGVPIPWRRGERWGRVEGGGGPGGGGAEGGEQGVRPSRPRGVPPEVYERFPTRLWGGDEHKEAVRAVAAARAAQDNAAAAAAETGAAPAAPASTVGGGDDDCCAVCLGEYAEGETLRVLPCAHYYHDSCVLKWMQSHDTCPVCRANLLVLGQEEEEAREEERRRRQEEEERARRRHPGAVLAAWASRARGLLTGQQRRPAGDGGGGVEMGAAAATGAAAAATAGGPLPPAGSRRPSEGPAQPATPQQQRQRQSSSASQQPPPQPRASATRRSSGGGGGDNHPHPHRGSSAGGGSLRRFWRLSSPRGRRSDDSIEPQSPPGPEAAAEIEAARRAADAAALSRALDEEEEEQIGLEVERRRSAGGGAAAVPPAVPFPEAEMASLSVGGRGGGAGP